MRKPKDDEASHDLKKTMCAHYPLITQNNYKLKKIKIVFNQLLHLILPFHYLP